ncbi:unnamed protein product [Orchesella dallaii]|uniref:F-box domain-containing protein n=1 Tax=Orchesella dallaii TaxID=48710 RepID=A0ABP1PV17_9HEXA
MSEGNFQLCQSQPVHHYPILKSIVNNLAFQDLLSFREVCLSWKTVADQILRTKGKLIIDGNDNFEKFLQVLRKAKPGSLPTTIVLRRVCINDSFNFGLHASLITSLTLSQCNWNNDTMIMLCSQLTQLDTLCIEADPLQSSHSSSFIHNKSSVLLDHKYNFTNLTSLYIRGDHGFNIVAVLLLLRNSPNLKILTYKKINCTDSDIYGNWLQTKIFSSCAGIRNLNCLELDTPFRKQNFKILMEVTFLMKLSINIEKDMLHDLMRTISHLKHLKCLEVGIIDRVVLPGSSIMTDISNFCPNLEKVAIHSPNYPRITLVSVACFMLEEMQLFL